MTTDKKVIKKDTSRARKLVLLALFLLYDAALLAWFLVPGLRPASNSQTGSGQVVQATQAYTPGQAMTITAQNVTVYVPQDSINVAGTILVNSRQPNLFPAAGQETWSRPQIVNVEFLNSEGAPVSGISFSRPIQVCFTLTPEQWGDFTEHPDAYQIQYYAVENDPPAWVALPMAKYPNVSTLCGQVNHLSLFALAVQVEPSIPVTGPTATPSRTSPRPGSTNPSGPPPADTQPPPIPTQLLPTNTSPAPTEPPPPTDTEPAPTFPIPIPTLPAIGIL